MTAVIAGHGQSVRPFSDGQFPADGTGCFVVLATCHALVGCNREMVFVLV
jgi:hypothetical protein